MDAQIYITGPPGSHSKLSKGSDIDTPTSISADEKDSTAFDSQPNFPCYQTRENRPDIKAILEEAISLSEGSVAVGGKTVSFPPPLTHTRSLCKFLIQVAGPPQLAQTVRGSLGFSSSANPLVVLRGGPLITLHTETFGTVRG